MLLSMSEGTPLMKRAAALIACRAYSRGELRRRLATAQKAQIAQDAQDTQNTQNADEIEAVLDRLEHLNLLNDAEYAYDFALYRIKDSGWGEEKVLKALLDRDVSMAVADKALERVREKSTPEDVDSFDTALMKYVEGYCRKHGTPSNSKAAQKLARRLTGRGFDEDRIVGALERIISPDVFRDFTKF